MNAKLGYFAVAVVSAAVIVVLATQIGGLWHSGPMPARALLLFNTSEGLTVVPAQ